MAITQISTGHIKDDAVTTAKIAPSTVIPADLDATGSYTMAGLQVNGTITTTGTITSPAMPPIGTIIPIYDYNGALTFNATYWAYCDGSSKTVGGIGAQTLPDLSNRYLVGFGTEGGGDIDSAAWATAAVGNASHEIDLQHLHGITVNGFTISSANLPTHTHVIDHGHANTFALGGTVTFPNTSHTHTISNHVHTNPTTAGGSAHSHGVGTYKFKTGERAGGEFDMYQSDGTAIQVAFNTSAYASGGQVSGFCNTATEQFYTKDGAGVSANESAHTHTQGNTGNPTSNPASGTPSANTSTVTFSGSVTNHSGSSGNGGFANNSITPTASSDNQLSTTQTVQPRSVRVRYIMRIK